jgi:hypothetical protein
MVENSLMMDEILFSYGKVIYRQEEGMESEKAGKTLDREMNYGILIKILKYYSNGELWFTKVINA